MFIIKQNHQSSLNLKCNLEDLPNSKHKFSWRFLTMFQEVRCIDLKTKQSSLLKRTSFVARRDLKIFCVFNLRNRQGSFLDKARFEKKEKKMSAEFTSVPGEVAAKNRRKEENAPGWTSGQKVFVDCILYKTGLLCILEGNFSGWRI